MSILNTCAGKSNLCKYIWKCTINSFSKSIQNSNKVAQSQEKHLIILRVYILAHQAHLSITGGRRGPPVYDTKTKTYGKQSVLTSLSRTQLLSGWCGKYALFTYNNTHLHTTTRHSRATHELYFLHHNRLSMHEYVKRTPRGSTGANETTPVFRFTTQAQQRGCKWPNNFASQFGQIGLRHRQWKGRSRAVTKTHD